MENLFTDTSKFTKINADPTVTRRRTLHSYLNTLLKRGKIREEEKEQICPLAEQLGRAHGLSKTQKSYQSLP